LGDGSGLPELSRGLFGIDHVLNDPPVKQPNAPSVERIIDPALAGWLRGSPPGSDPSLATYQLHPSPAPVARAWLVEGQIPVRTDSTDPASDLVDTLRHARPLTLRTHWPERMSVEVQTEARDWVVVVSVLDDPEWEGVWRTPGRESPAPWQSIFRGGPGSGGWMAFEGHGAGQQELVLTYRGRAARLGLLVSGLAWAGFGVAYWRRGRGRRRKADPTPTGPEMEQDSDR
jgi:hypothetical protein